MGASKKAASGAISAVGFCVVTRSQKMMRRVRREEKGGTGRKGGTGERRGGKRAAVVKLIRRTMSVGHGVWLSV